jgi:uncharacterized OB-fold protein
MADWQAYSMALQSHAQAQAHMYAAAMAAAGTAAGTGAAGGAGGGGGGGGGAGATKYRPDWQCPMCAHVNFARRNACENCGQPRTAYATPAFAPTHAAVQEGMVQATEGTPLMKGGASDGNQYAGAPIVMGSGMGAGMGAGMMGGGMGAGMMGGMGGPGPGQYPPDWKCLQCGNINFARRAECKQCGAPRTADSPATHISQKYQPDWRCTACGNVNFARRTECKRCGAPRTEDAEPAYAPSHAVHKMMGRGPPGMGMGMGMGGRMPPMPKPGDWNCPSCSYLNFARRTDCGKCGTPKPEGAIATAAPEGGAGAEGAGAGWEGAGHGGSSLSGYRYQPY